jgi:hypothetical protein
MGKWVDGLVNGEWVRVYLEVSDHMVGSAYSIERLDSESVILDSGGKPLTSKKSVRRVGFAAIR